MIHKRQRVRELEAIIRYRRDPEGEAPAARGAREREITEMVWERRAADKTGPLVRWAEATIDADPALASAPLREQVAYFAGLLPDNTIGRHAVQHIESALKWRERPGWYRARKDPAAPSPEATAMRAQLQRILESGLHGVLNRELRTLTSVAEEKPRFSFLAPPPRLLLGSHDIEAFTAERVRWPEVRTLTAALASTGRLPEGWTRH